MIPVLGEFKKMLVVLKDEANDGKSPDLNLIIEKGVYGLFVRFEDEEDQRCIMVDYFDGKLSVKVWTDPDEEDFTNEIRIT